MNSLKRIGMKNNNRTSRKHLVQLQILITVFYILFTFLKISDSIMEIGNSKYEYDKITLMTIFENIIIISKLGIICSILYIMRKMC